MKRAYWLGTLLLVAACSGGGESTPPGGQDDDDVTADDDQDDDSTADDDNDDSSSSRRDAGGNKKPDAGKDAGSTKTDAKAPNDDKTPQPGTGGGSGLPCDVKAIVDKKCAVCHGEETKFGAPMSLTKIADFMEKDAKGRPYHEAALARVTGAEKPVMPPAQYALTAEEKTKITDWLTKKAPASTASCGGSDEKPDAGEGRPDIPTQEETECDVEMEFRAGHDKPFTVPTTPDYYHCFYFKPEFTPETVGKGFWPEIDNDKVIHHWLLFVKKDASKRPGTSEQCTGVNPGATLIAGWAPGGEPTVAPKDVGIDLPKGSDVIYQLELHYNNTVGAGATDHSGVKLCATKNKQKELAAIHYLGSENILVLPNSMGTAQSTCTPKQPVTLLSVNPHMHKTGHHAKMIINRKNGTKETYHDEPFSFDSQVNWNKTAKLEVGDTITSSCTFKNDTSMVKVFQEGTNDEMCYLFTLAYPIGAMDTGSDLLGVGLPGPNRCMR